MSYYRPHDTTEKICIIGAGPGGLCAAIALKAKGIPFDVIDKGSQPGGVWDINRPDGAMYESAHFISSKTMSGFSDFPMPDDYPDYPRHDKILTYIQAYAKKHQLDAFIRFQTTVQQIVPVEDGKLWKVSFSNGPNLIYKGIICATGLSWDPNLPEYEGKFDGEMYHTSKYTSSKELKNKKVLIIGAGNSGCDIACDAAKSAKKAFISMRRGYYFIPKYIFGVPADVFGSKGPKLPHWLETKVNHFILNKLLVGNLQNYGLPKPDHNVLESHPIMNTNILHHFGQGDLVPKKEVKEFKSQSVVFEDDTEEGIDLILMATGYKRSYPFIDDQYLQFQDGKLDLYLEIFDRKYDNLFFLGGIETDGAAFEMFGKQANLIARFLEWEEEDPQKHFQFKQTKTNHRPKLKGGSTYINSQRHNYYVQSHTYQKVLNGYLKE